MNPEWNSADPRASLLAQWEFFHDHARQLFLQDGTHVEILFLLAKDGTMQPVPIAPPMTREEVTSQLREQLPGSRVYGLIHIGEAWAMCPMERMIIPASSWSWVRCACPACGTKTKWSC